MKIRILISLAIIPILVLVGCGAPPATLAPLTSTPTEIVPTETPIPSTPIPIPTPTEVPNITSLGFHTMAYDIESNKVILKPYMVNFNFVFDSTPWTLDLDKGVWQRNSGGPPKGGGSIVYDSQSDRTILFIGKLGGWSKNFGKPTGQTWAYDYNTDTWTDMNPEGGPYNLVGQGMAYDSESDRIILFGGFGKGDVGGLTKSYETWAYDFETNTWTNMQPSGDIPQGNVAFYPISYDAGADRILAWICEAPNVRKIEGCAINAYDYNFNTWERRETDPHPMSSYYNAMIYDPGTGLNILFGGATRLFAGEDFRKEETVDELWGYDYANNTWTQLPSKNLPSARCCHAMVYDNKTGTILMSGGGYSLGTLTNETWSYNPAIGEWSQIVEGQ